MNREQRNGITQSLLHELFDYDQGRLINKVRDRKHFITERGWLYFNSRYAGLSSGSEIKWKGKKDVRVVTRIAYKGYLRSRLVWIYHYGDIPADKPLVDHVFGNTLDDRIENLRLVDNVTNMNNCNKYVTNKSGVTGVCQGKDPDVWTAFGRVSGKQVELYRGRSFADAVAARKAHELANPYMTARHGK